jgi:hypothetical protein
VFSYDPLVRAASVAGSADAITHAIDQGDALTLAAGALEQQSLVDGPQGGAGCDPEFLSE